MSLEAPESGSLDWAVRTEIYRGFATDRLPPSPEELARRLEAGVADVRDSDSAERALAMLADSGYRVSAASRRSRGDATCSTRGGSRG